VSLWRDGNVGSSSQRLIPDRDFIENLTGEGWIMKVGRRHSTSNRDESIADPPSVTHSCSWVPSTALTIPRVSIHGISACESAN